MLFCIASVNPDASNICQHIEILSERIMLEFAYLSSGRMEKTDCTADGKYNNNVAGISRAVTIEAELNQPELTCGEFIATIQNY